MTDDQFEKLVAFVDASIAAALQAEFGNKPDAHVIKMRRVAVAKEAARKALVGAANA